MKKAIFFTCLISLIVLYSCKGKPSDSDIKKKILMEYTCPETSKVNSLNIISTKDAEAISGVPAYEYVVTGEIMPAGHVERFENKHVFLAKVDGNWQ
jgi:hypothetical protein